MEKENKIDKAIDEILESKRLREGANVIKKTFKVVITLGVVFFIISMIAVALGIVK